jgi:WD repeat-containing protein 19
LEVTITSMLEGTGTGAGQSMTIAADIEPNFLALGPYHLALGMNNRAW